MELPFLVVVCWGFVAGDNSGFNLEQHMNARDKELALQAELLRKYNYVYSKELQEFVALVRADEREKCSRIRAGKPRILPSVGTGALWGEQAHCFAKGWHEGAASVRKAIEARGNP